MRVAKLVETSIARPGIETRGKVVGPKAIARTIREQLGARKALTLLPPVSDDWEKGPLKYFKWLVKLLQNGSRMREALNKLPEHIELSGIKSKFIVDRSLEFDPDCPNERIPYDPVTDMSAAAVKRLLQETQIEPSQIGSFYLATTTPNSFDPPPAVRVLAKLIRDKAIPRKVVEGDGRRNGWKTRGVNEGCVGSVIALENIEQDMELRALSDPNDHRYALAVFAAANSIHMKPESPHEIINYGDGAAAMLFMCTENDSGNITIADEKHDMKEVDKVVHQLKPFNRYSIYEKFLRYFSPTSNYGASKRVAKNIADRCPDYLLSLAADNGFNVWDFDHLVLSQTSKGVVDRVEFGVAEKIRASLGLNPNIRPELKAHIEEMADESSFTLLKEKDLLTTNLFRIIENDRWTELLPAMSRDEVELMNYMILLHQSVVRTYPTHSYTGVSSIPMAIAQGVMDKTIDLRNDSIAMVSSGLCGRMKGAIISNSSFDSGEPNLA